MTNLITRREMVSLSAMAMAAMAARVHGEAQFTPDIEIELTARPSQAQILPGRATDVWQFTGRVLKGPASSVEPIKSSYLGPTLRLRRGQKVRIRFLNRLPDASIVHWHGLDVPENADGHPRLAVDGGKDYLYEFEVTTAPAPIGITHIPTCRPDRRSTADSPAC
jgi:blue copper oxidase